MSPVNIPKPDPKAFYVCVENHVSERGIYKEGDRLRGDHPDVKASTIWWVEETLDTEQRHAARQARLLFAYPIQD
jgi:hypothetical protein